MLVKTWVDKTSNTISCKFDLQIKLYVHMIIARSSAYARPCDLRNQLLWIRLTKSNLMHQMEGFHDQTFVNLIDNSRFRQSDILLSFRFASVAKIAFFFQKTTDWQLLLVNIVFFGKLEDFTLAKNKNKCKLRLWTLSNFLDEVKLLGVH